MKHRNFKFLLAIFMSMTANIVSAYDAEINGIFYNFDTAAKTASVVKGLSYYDDVDIPETVIFNGTTYNVTNIGDFAFEYCNGVTSVTIPESVTTIGYGAFHGCTDLTSVHITDLAAWCGIRFVGPYSNPLTYAHQLYLNGKEVKDLIIPEGVTSIGSSAFSGCISLTSVTIPSSVTNIGSEAFQGCSSLAFITIPESVTEIDHDAFSDCIGLTSVTIPNSVTPISGYAFSGCSGLTSVIIGDGVTSIGEWAFVGCTGLLSANIGNSVISIGSSAFSGCIGLSSVTIPESVSSIGYGAFYGCTGLTSVTIPNSVTSIGGAAFYRCTGLTSVTIPESVTSIDGYAFYGCTGLISVIIGDGVTSIGDEAFCGCTGLTSVTIPNSVTSIGSGAFSGCTGFTSVTIPNSVTSIGYGAFSGCTSLVELSLGKGLKQIEDWAFAGSKIRQLLIKCATPPASSLNVFSEQTYYQTTLYVPIGKKDDYAYSDSWYKFNTIKESVVTEAMANTENAYTLMNVKSFTYAAYDAVNNRIKMVSASNVDENNVNHCWQTVEVNGKKFLYNIGAKMFAVPATDGSAFNLSPSAESISMSDGDDGIILGGNANQQWALVIDPKMDADMSLEEKVTPVESIDDGQLTIADDVYDLSGRKLSNMHKGLNIVRMSDGTVKKVLVK